MDRNNVSANYHIRVRESLSARRAWIEMQISVSTVVGVLSLSARRAWIEISQIWYCGTSIGRRSPQGERG